MIGQTISHYRITEKLGEGGMGVVYKAEDTRLRRTVAVKFLAPSALGNDSDKRRFLREAQAAGRLDHPNIASVYDVEEADGQTFIVMAYVDGPSLTAKIAEGPLKLEEALDVGVQIAQGLQEAHGKRIVHRDINCQNILLTSKGRVKITDFGLAYLADRSKLTKSGTTMGTPAYMSPEQAQGQTTDLRSDLWSLGVVLYEMLTGRLPFHGECEEVIVYSILNEEPQPVTTLRSELPREVDRIVLKALAKRPDERYQHADDLAVDLRRLCKQRRACEDSSADVVTLGSELPDLSSTGAFMRGTSPTMPIVRSKSFVTRLLIVLLAVAICVITYLVLNR